MSETAEVKRGPKPGMSNAQLMKRIERLEEIICKMAHYGGGGFPSILKEFGLDPYQPTKEDMRRGQ